MNISLRELARRLGITPPFLSDIELGRRYPSDETMGAIAKEFGISVDDLRQLDHRESMTDFKKLVETPAISKEDAEFLIWALGWIEGWIARYPGKFQPDEAKAVLKRCHEIWPKLSQFL